MLRLDLNARKHIYYYLIFLFIFTFSHIAVYSTISFFHFLLDHDMSTIESWISKNNWEVLIFAKLLSFTVCLKFLALNEYYQINLKELFKFKLVQPSLKAVLLSCFLIGVSTILSKLFYLPSNISVENEQNFLSAFLGIIIFFGLDFVLLTFLNIVFPVPVAKQRILFIYLSILFAFTTQLAIPYLGLYLVVVVLHFVALATFIKTRAYADAALYGLLVIGPMNALLGLNLFNGWAEVQSFRPQLFLSLLLIWCIGLVYYRFSQLD